MAKMSFVLIALCALATLTMAEPYGAMPPPATYPTPAKYEAPTPAPSPAPAKYEAPTPAPAPVPAMYEEKKEKYPMKPEYKKMEYGGKKYRRSVEALMDMDAERFEDEEADAKRKWWSDEDVDELMHTAAKRRWASPEDMDAFATPKRKWWSADDELMDAAPKRKWWTDDDMQELMDAIRWRNRRRMFPGMRGGCIRRGGRRRCM